MRRTALPMLAIILAMAPAQTLAQGTGEASGADAVAKPAVEQVSVKLDSFSFTPAQLTFLHGQAYRLHLANTSSGGHDFDAPEFFAASDIAPGDRAKVADGKVNLGGGDSAEIRLTPLKPGTYKLRCTHFMHGAFGMKGTITVD